MGEHVKSLSEVLVQGQVAPSYPARVSSTDLTDITMLSTAL